VYDGDSTDAPLLGTFCNYNVVNHLQSSNAEGALTFTFTSDNNTTKAGWKAHIESSPLGTVTFKITNGVDGISGALVSFANQLDSTNMDGEISFANVLSYGEKNYSISKQGYFTYTGTLNEIEGDTTITLLLEPLPDICFTVHDATTLLENVAMTFDGRTLYSDVNGSMTFVDVIPGTKTFYASKEGYVDTTGTIVVDNIDVCLNVSMRPKPTYEATILVNDANGLVSNALVVLGVDSLYTDASGTALFTGIFAGNYALTVKKEGYVNKSSALDIVDSDVDKEITLAFITYAAYFTVLHGEEAVADATISLLEHELTTSYYGEAFLNGIIPAVSIPYTVTHDAYNTYEGAFDLADHDVEIQVNLSPVGIDASSLKGIRVYPNPINKNKELFIASDGEIQQVLLLNLAGMQLINKKCNSKEYALKLSDIKSGIYILQLKMNGTWMFEKIIVE
jgi:hypothetical protein